MRNDSGEPATLQRIALALGTALATAMLSGCMVVGATMAVGSAAVSTVATVGSAAVSVASTTYDVTAAGVKAVAGGDDPPPPQPAQASQPAEPAQPSQ